MNFSIGVSNSFYSFFVPCSIHKFFVSAEFSFNIISIQCAFQFSSNIQFWSDQRPIERKKKIIKIGVSFIKSKPHLIEMKTNQNVRSETNEVKIKNRNGMKDSPVDGMKIKNNDRTKNFYEHIRNRK